eukprot:9494733-Pyramimonas_sp.AAC.1
MARRSLRGSAPTMRSLTSIRGAPPKAVVKAWSICSLLCRISGARKNVSSCVHRARQSICGLIAR